VPPEWSLRRSFGMLLVSAAALTAVSEVLVHTLEPTVAALGVSKLFIGMILIPIIGNLAEHIVGVTLAYKNKMDFSLITSLGSATQIALFAAPVLVFFSLVVGQPLTLVFTPLEVVAVHDQEPVQTFPSCRSDPALGMAVRLGSTEGSPDRPDPFAGQHGVECG